MPIRANDHTPQRDTVAVDQQGALGALFVPVNGGSAGDLPTTGGLDDAPVHTHVLQVESDDAVVVLQAQLLQLGEDPGLDPFIPAGAQGGGRAGGI